MMTAEDEKLRTFAAFEGRVSGNTVRGVSLLAQGPALGHGVWVDAKMLEQAKKAAAAKGKVKAKINHWSGIEDTVGFYENFRIRAGKLIADLQLFESSQQSAQLLEMIEAIPESFGVSIMFAADEPEYDEENDRLNARLSELFSADFVDTPAANKGVFEVGIDNAKEDMVKPTTEPEQKPEAYDAKAAIVLLEDKIAALTTALEAAKPKEDPAPTALEKKDETASIIAALEDKLDAFTKAFALAQKPTTPPAPAQEQGDDANPLEITRAQFDAIPVGERGAFFAKGGKLKI